MFSNIYNKLKTIKLWNLLWISLILSELFTAIMNIIMGLIWYGRIDIDLLLIGSVDGFVVALFVGIILILIFREIRNYERDSSEAVRRAKEEWEITFNSMSDLIMILDMNHKVVRTNKAMSDKLGLTPSETVGITCYEHMHGLNEPPSFCPHSKYMLDGQEHSVEIYEERLGGYYLVTDTPLLNTQGKVVGSVHTAKDITESKRMERMLRESEERLRQAVRVSQIGFFDHDHRSNTIYWSPELRKAHGWGMEEIVSFPAFLDCIYLEDRERIAAAIRRAHDPRGNGLFEIEQRTIRRDGEVRWLSTRSQTYFEGEGDARRPVRTVGASLDITDRKRAEEEIRMLKHSIDSHYDGAYWIDSDNKFVYVNDAGCKALGYTREELIGKSIYEVNPRVNAERMKEVWAGFRQGGSFSVESVHRRKDGSEFPVEVVNTYVRFGDKEYVCGFARDITDRKRTEELLREQKSFTENLIENSAVATFVLNPKHKILLWNKACEALTGFRASDMIGTDNQWKPFYAYKRPTLADCIVDGDFDRVPLLYEKSARSVLVANGLQAEGWYINLNGRDRYVIFDSSPVYNSKGELIVVIETLQDITDRKHAEEKLRQNEEFTRTILDTVDEGFIIIDPDYRILSANKAYCRQIKCETENIIGKHCHEVSHHQDKPCFSTGEVCAPSRTFKTGKPSLAIHTHYDSDNKPVYLETRSYPVKDQSGAVTAVIETLNNVTELRMLEEQLRHAQKMEAIGMLAGGIAHDFNNILTAILGYGSLIERGMKSNDPALPHLKEILAAGQRAAQLTRGLLAFSRKQVMDLKAVNINSIIANFKKMVERIIGEDIEFRVLASEDLIVNADTGQIEQVLMNLAANARDAMPHGGMLTIKTEITTMDSHFVNTHGFGEPGSYAVITVTDTGTGMDDTTRERIFEPYFTTKDLSKGTGLGLSIAFGIVKQHKGFIECKSDLGTGTSFIIFLPLASTGEDKELNEEIQSLTGGVETVLIAEDDAAVRSLTRQILSEFGYTVIEAVDGEDAVKKFRDNQDRIKLLLFDVIMPKKSGKEAYEDIRHMRPDIKTIFISGYAKDLIQDDGIHDHDAVFLQKPVSQKELLKKIRALLDR